MPRSRIAVATDRRLLVGVAAITLSVAGYLATLVWRPSVYYALTDGTVYRDAGLAVAHHLDAAGLYTTGFGVAHIGYLYTPFAALVLAVLAPLPWAVWKAGLVAADIACVIVVCLACVRMVRLPSGPRRVGIALVLAAVGLWSQPVQRDLSFGQVNLILMTFVVLDLADDRRRWSGVGVGIAAGVKLTPLIFVPYLWFAGRRRAALISLLTFAAMLGVGFALLPGNSAKYWGSTMVRGDLNTGQFNNQSLMSLIWHITHGASRDHTLWLIAVLALVPVALAAAVAAARRGQPLLGLVICGVTSLLVSPISWTHHWVYVLPALALALPGARWLRHRWSRVAFGAAVIVLFEAWPLKVSTTVGWDSSAPWSSDGLLSLVPHGTSDIEFGWNMAELLLGNYYVLAGLAFVGFATARLWRTRERDRAEGRRTLVGDRT